ncbi:TraB/VirB10 family protein [Massilia sp. CT11-137]|uniref:TraB/VirB10 family protein n=1 Tax=Massilia sp. CT11-137 TaxID=3393901 RepID=UPI0039A5BD67
MSDTGVIAKYRQQWMEMDPKFKYAIGAIIVGGGILMVVNSREREQSMQEEQVRRVATATAKANAEHGGTLPNSGNTFSALPSSNRNQGLEDLLASLDKARTDAKEAHDQSKSMDEQLRRMNERMAQIEGRAALPAASAAQAGGAGATGPASAAAPYENLPAPVDFGQPGTAGKDKGGATSPYADAALPPEHDAVKLRRTAMKVWDSEARPARHTADDTPTLTIPTNTALESVMLTGINARSNSSGGAASGTVLSANNVGAPFVSRLKGDAILPNGWRVSDFNDCFISGTGIAILSSERANVISNVMSCVDKRGNVYEAKIKAYGVDLDGIQGISGRVVTKQGSLLAKTALAGVASGLGTAFSPTALPGYNQNMQSGDRQGIQWPNPSLVAGSALGGGVNEASKALARFYLDYAKEMFPVIEVNAGTRVTWILQETVELNPMRKTN